MVNLRRAPRPLSAVTALDLRPGDQVVPGRTVAAVEERDGSVRVTFTDGRWLRAGASDPFLVRRVVDRA